MTGVLAERAPVPLDHGRHQLGHHHFRVVSEVAQGGSQCEAHAQTADQHAGPLSTGDFGARDLGQRIRGPVGSSAHEVLTAHDFDHEVFAVPVEAELATAVRYRCGIEQRHAGVGHVRGCSGSGGWTASLRATADNNRIGEAAPTHPRGVSRALDRRLSFLHLAERAPLRRVPLLRALEPTECPLANLSPSETEGSLSRRAWISRVLVESVLVVGSILLALALDEWNEGQDYQDLATLSLLNFEREIQQNRLRLEDVTPFHVGLRDVLANMDIDDAAVPATTIRNILEGFQPALLVSTAWETAVATGALGYMDYEVVAGLSRTYNLQEQLTNLSRSGMNDLLMGGFRSEETDLLIYTANRYVRELTEAEQGLEVVYDLVLGLIAENIGERPDTTAVVDSP